ncbi:DUF1294 domain-containing protein [Pseudocolwellia sp. HL-MZ7]|uniref:DUF1294 domain-containing protein n=1 Tax=Pseudocolwellia sp. HL-MZ7 TaxID=3400627 RepID=UPI003CF1DD1A
MLLKGKLIKWDETKAFGFILPHGGGEHIFIRKNAFSNKQRVPQINDVITFSITKDRQERYCADNAYFTGEKMKPKNGKQFNLFSIYLSCTFLAFLSIAFIQGKIPQHLLVFYMVTSVVSFIAYALDKSRAQQGAWRIKESTLHLIALLGGWPGAALAQQVLRHKSQKKEFRNVIGLLLS